MSTAERTALEKRANDFDLELFRLMARARGYSDESSSRLDADVWNDVANLLSRARIHARSMMSKEDQALTINS